MLETVHIELLRSLILLAFLLRMLILYQQSTYMETSLVFAKFVSELWQARHRLALTMSLA